MAVRMILEDAGYKVVEASSGDEGLDQMRENEEINLVLLDLLMPEKNGFEVLDDIQSDADDWVSGLPVIVMSSSDSEDDKSECLRLGAKLFFHKPLHSA